MEEFDEVYDEAMEKINHDFEKYMGEQSGWVLDSISSIDLNIARYKPIRGASYTETPRALRGKTAILNIQNDDLYCFLYCILAFLYPVSHKDHAYRPNKYKPYLHTLNYKDLEIDKFEKMNDLIINVYSCNEDGNEIYPR